MPAKIFRDPLYNYISVDRKTDGWLLDLLDTPEIQRLRRIHQLGVSYLTYPGADHNRLAHSLGVVHLMQQALRHLEAMHKDAQVEQIRVPLLASALVHDVGHAPFSHLLEASLGGKHEAWSKAVILDEDSGINRVLRKVARSIPQTVAELIDEKNTDHPSWAKYLLSSQLDVDRLDYLRRDSLFTGAGYGHFDFHRLLNSFELYENPDGDREIVWADKSRLAVEEYIFSRYYMYQNVYLHKTTRGFEKMIVAMWGRAKSLAATGADVGLVPTVADFWRAGTPSVRQYLAIEEFTVFQQIQNWTTLGDKSLSDLARRFLARQRFAGVDPPNFGGDLAPDYAGWEAALRELVRKSGYDPPEMYCLPDRMKGQYNQPYFPEKESDEQSVKNAIRINIAGEARPVEISRLLDRLKPLTQEPVDRVRYFVPKDVQAEALRLRSEWSKKG
jgi:HD superfamily phosphohydrolase